MQAELLMEAARVKLLVSSMLLDEKVSEGDRRQVADKYMNQVRKSYLSMH
jgi:hypothetical protein